MKRIKNYEIVKLLGHGNSAEVHLAIDTSNGKKVAIKLLHAFIVDNEVKQDFFREVQFISKLRHPSIIQVLDAGFDDTRPFFILSYASQGNLRFKHPQNSILSNDTIINYTNQIAHALEYAHQQNIIHRDIKPENILLNEHSQLLLSDFGIAQIAHSTLSQSTKGPAGTPIYAAPEQLRGKPKKASDQYSLAIMVYEWLCGTPPFGGKDFNKLYDAHLFNPLPSIRERNHNIIPTIETILIKALDKNYEQRFPTIMGFAQAIEQAFNPPNAYKITMSSPTRPKSISFTTKPRATSPLIKIRQTSLEQGQKSLFTVLDIGTALAKAVIVEVHGDYVKVLGVGHHPQNYIYTLDNAISNIPTIIDNCNEAILKAELAAGGIIAKTAIIGIASELVRSNSTTISKQRGRPTQQITADELETLIMAAQERLLKNIREQIATEIGYGSIDVHWTDATLTSIRIDGQSVVNPIGFRGRHFTITLFSSFVLSRQLDIIESITKGLDLIPAAFVTEPYALASCSINNINTNDGAIFIDIGGNATNIGLVREGVTKGSLTFALGGHDFTHHISISKGISINEAEHLKIKHCNSDLKGTIYQEIQAILAPKCQTWIDNMKTAIEELANGEPLPSMIYILGGGSLLPDLHQCLESFTWIESLPFSHQPIIRTLQTKMIDNIIDNKGMLTNEQDIILMALAYQAVEMNNESTAVGNVLSQAIKSTGQISPEKY